MSARLTISLKKSCSGHVTKLPNFLLWKFCKNSWKFEKCPWKFTQKEDFLWTFCTREFIKSVHKNSPILSTKIRLLFPLEICHPLNFQTELLILDHCACARLRRDANEMASSPRSLSCSPPLSPWKIKGCELDYAKTNKQNRLRNKKWNM